MEAGKHSVKPDVDIANVSSKYLACKTSYMGFKVVKGKEKIREAFMAKGLINNF